MGNSKIETAALPRQMSAAETKELIDQREWIMSKILTRDKLRVR